MNPIAYVYEADYHCPACTEERFGRGTDGYIASDAVDSEGNSVGAVFSWDEWWEPSSPEPETLYCGDCFGEIAHVDGTE